ncbi:hypothetical protein M5D96_001354 [Drosophila gunungcola]|uniref:Uncharacterized protein n=1 Tax=Drosophila gunungcola TaxID=103775 RepID=A0A9P9YXV9_9MUSC|nr:hypothetical protein M5D96_001354 [Drosophila gunungcola]
MHELIGKYSHPDMDMLKDQLRRGSFTPGPAAPSPFLMPAEFYKSLFASAVLQQQQQQQQQHKFHAGMACPSPAPSLSPSSGRSHPPTAACVAESGDGQVKTELEEPDQETLENEGHEEQRPPENGKHPTRHKPHSNNNGYSWSSSNNNEVVSNNNHHPATPPTPPSEATATQATSVSAINLNQAQPASQARPNFGSSVKSPPTEADAVTAATCKSQESSSSNPPPGPTHNPDPSAAQTASSNPTAAAVAAAAAAAAAANMPIGGVQGQNPTQGLVHWMSAVMAEHMTGQTHHDPTGAVGMHYMWNGNVDHAKDISDYNLWPPTPRSHQHASEHHPMSLKQEYEAKMNDHHHNSLQKGESAGCPDLSQPASRSLDLPRT